MRMDDKKHDPAPSYRGRIAPSPTGPLHLGHAMAFLEAESRCRSARGTLIYRDEDLDPERCKPEFFESAVRSLHDLGIAWQEGPKQGGPYAPYRQSKRRDFYLIYFYKLILLGAVYPCAASRREIRKKAGKQGADGEAIFPAGLRPSQGKRDGFRRDLAAIGSYTRSQNWLSAFAGVWGSHFADLAGGLSLSESRPPWEFCNWRFLVPSGRRVGFVDGRLGEQGFASQMDFGDFLVWRKIGMPSYELAVVVDDSLMKISEVVRGEDLLVSTARQILVYEALGLPRPEFCHCRLLRDKAGNKLSKRNGDANLNDLIQHRGAEFVLEQFQLYQKSASFD